MNKKISALILIISIIFLNSCSVYQKQIEDITEPPLTTTNIIINQDQLYDTEGKVKGFIGCINLKCNLFDTRSGYGYNKGNFIVISTKELQKQDVVKIAQCTPSRYCKISVEGKYVKAPMTSAGVAFVAKKIRYMSYKDGTVSVDANLW